MVAHRGALRQAGRRRHRVGKEEAPGDPQVLVF